MNNTMTKERYLEIKKTFKAFVRDKDNHSSVDERHGHKIEGKVGLVHFVLYAMLRNRNHELATHNVESGTYLTAITTLDHLAKSPVGLASYWPRCWSQVNKPFGLTEDEFREITLRILG